VVPAAAVRGVREEADRELAPATLHRLDQTLGRDTLDALFQALLAEPDRQKPILLILPKVGAEGAVLRRRLVEFLFALLPHPSRRRLTFTTDLGDSAAYFRGASAGGSPGTPAGGLPRLALTADATGVSWPRSPDAAVAWIIDAASGRCVVPEERSTLAQFFLNLLRGGRLAELLELRNLANDLECADEFSAIGLACDLWRLLRREELAPSDYRTFARAAAAVRPDRLPAGLLPTSKRLTHAWVEQFRDDASLLRDLSLGHLEVLARVLTSAKVCLTEFDRHLLASHVEFLFLQAKRIGAWELYAELAEVLHDGCTDPALQEDLFARLQLTGSGIHNAADCS
jgi:hypothetical protein